MSTDHQVLDDLEISYHKGIAGINEKSIRDSDPKQLTMKLASAKMDVIYIVQPDVQRVLEKNEGLHNMIWITADQVAYKDGTIREKPTSKKECYEYLQSYAYSNVQFYSAICVYSTETKKRFVDCDVSSIHVSQSFFC